MARARPREAEVFRAVRRACYAGLDSVTLRAEVASRLAPLIPADGYSMSTVDPDTGLFTHAVTGGIPSALLEGWVHHAYPLEGAAEILDQARSGRVVASTRAPATIDLFRDQGFAHELRAVLCDRGTLWGSSCLLRGSDAPAFHDRDAAFMGRIAPHLAAGLRASALLETAEAAPDDGGPGVLVLDGVGRERLRNPAAAGHLADLADVGPGGDALPYAVSSAVLRMRLRHLDDGCGSGALDGDLRVRGRSGRWYTVRASLSEPDAAGEASIIVLIEPARPAEIAAVLTRLYGLTPREREILALAARGESTKQIALRLCLSAYTVQEHLGNACTRVGVRTRKALLAKLFFDGYAARLLE